MINEDYQSQLEVPLKRYWTLMYELAKQQQTAWNKGFFDYFNSNPNNPLYAKLGYKKTKILKFDRAARIIPNIIIELIGNGMMSL